MKRLGLDVGFAQLVSHDFSRKLGRHKHQHPAPLVLLNQVAQQLRAPAGVHRKSLLHDVALRLRLHLNAHRVHQQRVGQGLHGGGKGGREKQVLALLGQQCQQAVEFFRETQVQQAVRLVQHQQLDVGQGERVAVNQVQQAPGRGHHNVGAAAQAHHLRVDGHAAENDGDLQGLALGLGQGANGLTHLRRQLTRRHQHQGLRSARAHQRALLQPLQQGQRKRGRFARTGLGGAQHIAPLQRRGNGSQLNGRGRRPGFGGNGTQQGGRQTQGRKWHEKRLYGEVNSVAV